MLESFIKDAFALAYYLLISIYAIDYCGVLKSTGSSVDYKIHIISQALINKFGISKVAYVIGFIVGNGSGEQGSTQLAAYFTCYVIVRHTYAHLFAVAEYLGQTAAGT